MRSTLILTAIAAVGCTLLPVRVVVPVRAQNPDGTKAPKIDKLPGTGRWFLNVLEEKFEIVGGQLDKDKSTYTWTLEARKRTKLDTLACFMSDDDGSNMIKGGINLEYLPEKKELDKGERIRLRIKLPPPNILADMWKAKIVVKTE